MLSRGECSKRRCVYERKSLVSIKDSHNVGQLGRVLQESPRPWAARFGILFCHTTSARVPLLRTRMSMIKRISRVPTSHHHTSARSDCVATTWPQDLPRRRPPLAHAAGSLSGARHCSISRPQRSRRHHLDSLNGECGRVRDSDSSTSTCARRVDQGLHSAVPRLHVEWSYR